METYRLIKETEYLKMQQGQKLNLEKLPEEARGANFDIILNDVLNVKYKSEHEKAAAVQKALQEYLIYQHKNKPSSYDTIAPGQVSFPEDYGDTSKQRQMTNSEVLALFDRATNTVPPTPPPRKDKRTNALSKASTTREESDEDIQSVAKRTRSRKQQSGKGKITKVKKSKFLQKGNGWLSWS